MVKKSSLVGALFFFSWFSAGFKYLLNAKSPLMEILCGVKGVERLLFFF